MAVRQAPVHTLPQAESWHHPEGSLLVFHTTVTLAAGLYDFWVYPPFGGDTVLMVNATQRNTTDFTYGTAFTCDKTITTTTSPANYIALKANNWADDARIVDIQVFGVRGEA